MKKIFTGAAAVAVALGLTFAGTAPANAGVRLWQHVNYGGAYLGDFGVRTSYVGNYANDRASSLRVTAPARYAILHQHRDYGGARTAPFYIGSPNLVGWNFNDKTSSIS